MPEKTTNTALKKAVAELEKSVTRSADAIGARAQALADEAQDTQRVAEMIGGMGVDSSTVGETKDIAKTLDALAAGARSYASAGHTTAKSAQAAHDQTRASHDAVQDAYRRAPVDISNMNREWLTQE
ncbi:hypothetical protein [Streptomyces xanthochromogenes]